MTGALYLPRASLSERLARQAMRLALRMVAGCAALFCCTLFAAACGLLSVIR